MKKSALIYFLIFIFAFGFLITDISAQNQPGLTNSVIKQQLAGLKDQLEFLKDVAKQFPDQRLENLIQQVQKHLIAANQAHQRNHRRSDSNRGRRFCLLLEWASHAPSVQIVSA